MTKALRVYRIEPPFKPQIISTLDLSSYLNESEKNTIYNVWYPNSEMLIIKNNLFVSFGNFLAKIDISNPENIKLISSYKVPEFIESISINGDYLFMALSGRNETNNLMPGKEKIKVFNISGKDIKEVASYNKDLEIPERIIAYKKRMYVAGLETATEEEKKINGISMSTGLKEKIRYRPFIAIFDISSPANIRFIAKKSLPLRIIYYYDSICRKMMIENNILYLADHNYGIRVFKIKSNNIEEIGGIRTISNETEQAVLTKDYVYMSGPVIIPIKITEKTSPSFSQDSIISCFSSAHANQYVHTLSHPYIYNIGDAQKELFIIDIKKPESPKIVDLFELPSNTLWFSFRTFGDYIYVFGNGQGDEKNTLGVCVLHSYENGRKLKIVKKMNLLPKKYENEKIIGFAQRGTCVENNRIYVIGYLSVDINGSTREKTVIFTFDISKPEEPVLSGNFSTDAVIVRGSHYYGGPDVYKNQLFFFTREKKVEDSFLCCFDMQNPENPELISKTLLEPSSKIVGYSGRIIILKPYPYILIQDYLEGLRLIDISDIKIPRIVWKEKIEKPYEIEEKGYSMYGWGGMIYDNGYVYAFRLDHLDIFKFEGEN